MKKVILACLACLLLTSCERTVSVNQKVMQKLYGLCVGHGEIAFVSIQGDRAYFEVHCTDQSVFFMTRYGEIYN